MRSSCRCGKCSQCRTFSVSDRSLVRETPVASLVPYTQPRTQEFVLASAGPRGEKGEKGDRGEQGIPGIPGKVSASNCYIVDPKGNDLTGEYENLSNPFQSITGVLRKIAGGSNKNTLILVMPGEYPETLRLVSGVHIHGIARDTVSISSIYAGEGVSGSSISNLTVVSRNAPAITCAGEFELRGVSLRSEYEMGASGNTIVNSGKLRLTNCLVKFHTRNVMRGATIYNSGELEIEAGRYEQNAESFPSNIFSHLHNVKGRVTLSHVSLIMSVRGGAKCEAFLVSSGKVNISHASLQNVVDGEFLLASAEMLGEIQLREVAVSGLSDLPRSRVKSVRIAANSKVCFTGVSWDLPYIPETESVSDDRCFCSVESSYNGVRNTPTSRCGDSNGSLSDSKSHFEFRGLTQDRILSLDLPENTHNDGREVTIKKDASDHSIIIRDESRKSTVEGLREYVLKPANSSLKLRYDGNLHNWSILSRFSSGTPTAYVDVSNGIDEQAQLGDPDRAWRSCATCAVNVPFGTQIYVRAGRYEETGLNIPGKSLVWILEPGVILSSKGSLFDFGGDNITHSVSVYGGKLRGESGDPEKPLISMAKNSGVKLLLNVESIEGSRKETLLCFDSASAEVSITSQKITNDAAGYVAQLGEIASGRFQVEELAGRGSGGGIMTLFDAINGAWRVAVTTLSTAKGIATVLHRGSTTLQLECTSISHNALVGANSLSGAVVCSGSGRLIVSSQLLQAASDSCILVGPRADHATSSTVEAYIGTLIHTPSDVSPAIRVNGDSERYNLTLSIGKLETKGIAFEGVSGSINLKCLNLQAKQLCKLRSDFEMIGEILEVGAESASLSEQSSCCLKIGVLNLTGEIGITHNSSGALQIRTSQISHETPGSNLLKLDGSGEVLIETTTMKVVGLATVTGTGNKKIYSRIIESRGRILSTKDYSGGILISTDELRHAPTNAQNEIFLTDTIGKIGFQAREISVSNSGNAYPEGHISPLFKCSGGVLDLNIGELRGVQGTRAFELHGVRELELRCKHIQDCSAGLLADEVGTIKLKFLTWLLRTGGIYVHNSSALRRADIKGRLLEVIEGDACNFEDIGPANTRIRMKIEEVKASNFAVIAESPHKRVNWMFEANFSSESQSPLFFLVRGGSLAGVKLVDSVITAKGKNKSITRNSGTVEITTSHVSSNAALGEGIFLSSGNTITPINPNL